jgi:hypothetical protein
MQVVVVGASETGLACLRHLQRHPRLDFKCLYLLTPGDAVLPVCLGGNVTHVNDTMAALDVQQHLVQLASSGRQLPYDLLIISSGTQEVLAGAIASACPDAAHLVLPAQQVLSGRLDTKTAANLQTVLLYGGDVAALGVAAMLMDARVPAGAAAAPSVRSTLMVDTTCCICGCTTLLHHTAAPHCCTMWWCRLC